MHTHCNGLTSAYVELALWTCVIAIWLLSSGFPACLCLSSSMSTEKLARAAGSVHTAALLLLLAGCHDGLSLSSWNNGELFQKEKKQTIIHLFTKKENCTFTTVKYYQCYNFSCLICIQKSVHTLTVCAFWWFGFCVMGLLRAVWKPSCSVWQTSSCFCDPSPLLLQPSGVKVLLAFLGNMSNSTSVWRISCKRNKQTELLRSVAES